MRDQEAYISVWLWWPRQFIDRFLCDITELIPARLVHTWVTWSTSKHMQTQSKIIIPVSSTT